MNRESIIVPLAVIAAGGEPTRRRHLPPSRLVNAIPEPAAPGAAGIAPDADPGLGSYADCLRGTAGVRLRALRPSTA